MVAVINFGTVLHFDAYGIAFIAATVEIVLLEVAGSFVKTKCIEAIMKYIAQVKGLYNRSVCIIGR